MKGWQLARRALRACQSAEKEGFGKFGEDDVMREVRGLMGSSYARGIALAIVRDWFAEDGGRRARRTRARREPSIYSDEGRELRGIVPPDF